MSSPLLSRTGNEEVDDASPLMPLIRLYSSRWLMAAANRSCPGVSITGVFKKYLLISTANASVAPNMRSVAPGSKRKVASDSIANVVPFACVRLHQILRNW